MTTSKREGYTLIGIGLGLCACCLIYFVRFQPFDWSNYVALFIGGVNLGMAFGSWGMLRQRERLNRFFGRDIWENGEPRSSVVPGSGR